MVNKLIDYKGEAHNLNGRGKVQLDGTYEIVEFLPYEPSNYVWQDSWVICELDDPEECYTIDVPTVVEYHDKIVPDVSQLQHEFGIDCVGMIFLFGDIMLARFDIYA